MNRRKEEAVEGPGISPEKVKKCMPREDRVDARQAADNSADFPSGHFRMVSGSTSDDFGNILAHQVCEALWYSADTASELKIRQVSAALAALRGIAPRDEIEGMLGAQMVAAHAAAMECYRRSMIRGQTFEARQAALKQAALCGSGAGAREIPGKGTAIRPCGAG